MALKDGRSLAYALLGAPLAGAAAVCIYHHGVPASLIEAEPIADAAAPLGIAIVAFDRPGESSAFCCCTRPGLVWTRPWVPWARSGAAANHCCTACVSAGMGGSTHNPRMSIQSVADDARQL